jgi:RHS repeat-associated protein
MATHFFWDPVEDNVVQERDDNGVITVEYATEPYLYGNLISQNRGGVERQYHFDSQGSTLALTDDNQQITDTYAYTAFGEVSERIGTTVTWFQYMGKMGYFRDEEIGEYNARRRSHFAKQGCWLSPDPSASNTELGIVFGAIKYAMWPNYIYCRNQPTILSDPSGLQECAAVEVPRCTKAEGCWRFSPGGKTCDYRSKEKTQYSVVPNGCTDIWGGGYMIWWSFYIPCNHHDECYAKCGASKKECDDKLRKEMLAECDRAYYASGNSSTYAQCYVLAQTMAGELSSDSPWVGQQARKAFEKEQDKACVRKKCACPPSWAQLINRCWS